MMADKLKRTELKMKAQDQLMNGIANVLGYWFEENAQNIPEGQRDEYQAIMKREADRIAKLFGFEEAWSN